MTHVGVVGAGAGSAALCYLLDSTVPDVEITVLEKSGGVCGRAATRRRSAITYDYGANYIKSDDKRVNELLTETLDAGGLVNIEEPIYVFEQDEEVSEGRSNDASRWSYETGLTRCAKQLFGQTDVQVHQNTRVAYPRYRDDTWTLVDTQSNEWGPFDYVVFNPPAPQTSELLSEADWDSPLRDELVDAIDAVPYRSLWSAVLHYPYRIEKPYYALVNTDKEHDIGWISREECKSGHVPADESVLIVQASPEWSERNENRSPEKNNTRLAAMTAEIMNDERLSDPDWTDHQFWRYALPDRGVNTGPVQSAQDVGLYCVGDWVAGEARVHAALRNGLDVGERIAYSLS